MSTFTRFDENYLIGHLTLRVQHLSIFLVPCTCVYMKINR